MPLSAQAAVTKHQRPGRGGLKGSIRSPSSGGRAQDQAVAGLAPLRPPSLSRRVVRLCSASLVSPPFARTSVPLGQGSTL